MTEASRCPPEYRECLRPAISEEAFPLYLKKSRLLALQGMLPLAVCFLGIFLGRALGTSEQAAQAAAEIQVLSYIRDHLRPGQPLLVTELYNSVFTKPEERKALDKLYSAFFRIPFFVAQYQERFGSPPRLSVIAQQFDLPNPQSAEILLRVMESDPRVPRFLTRDAKTHEITKVDVEQIRRDPRFGQKLEHQLSGWEGKPAPDFRLATLDGGELDLSTLRGRVVLLYVWFTGCPPCMKETPALAGLNRELKGQDLSVVGANADRVLELGYDDEVRRRYIDEHHVDFPVVHWTKESDAAYGNISIYPTLFLIDRKGVVIHHWVGFVSTEDLSKAIYQVLREK